jgi:multidrug efflux pump subunit AcrB
MWLVDLALRRPYTYIVMALMILLATPFALRSTPTDILPEIRIPVISIVWQYSGLPATDMGNRIAAVTERALTTTVNDIEHIESQSMSGITVVKLFFQPNANIQTALAQVVAISQTQLRMLPAGTTPPLIITYSASSVPVVQVGMSSSVLSEQQMNDLAFTQVRTQLITLPGAAVPFPYGGKSRVVSVDLDTEALLAKGLTPTDIVNAISAQNLILPAGTAKIGELEHSIRLNGSPESIAAMNELPVKSVNGSVTWLKEVAHVRDGFSPQVNIVKQNGQRGVLLSVMKNGGASTVQVVESVRAKLPEIAKGMPDGLDLSLLFDQSIFVKAAISSVVHEAVIASCLTAALILLFLGSWRSTLIIAVSIPLSILSSILVLNMLGETINLMTLGGLTLAIGILVDDATVTIENIERHMHLGKDLRTAIADGAGEIAVPALVSTLCICIVFLPMFFLTGVARYLFVPLAEAVIFAMLASYFLSRTLVPTLAMLMMKQAAKHGGETPTGWFGGIHRRFDGAFERMRNSYVSALSALLVRRRAFGLSFLAFCLLSCGLFFTLGEDFFPTVDAGQIRMHTRTPTGTRIEETARIADLTERAVRDLIPAGELGTVLANIGVPISGINLSYNNAGTFGAIDTEFLISLKEGHHPTAQYIDSLRRELPKRFPGTEFFFQPADIVSQILNFGSPAAIDIQFSGKDLKGNFALAQQLARKVQAIPGTVDVHVHQRMNQPTLALDVDRTSVQQLNLTAANVAQNVLVSLSGSFQTAPSFWLNPANGVVYNVLVQTPQHQVGSMDALMRTPVAPSGGQPQLLGNLVKAKPAVQPAVMSHYDIGNVVDIYVSVQGRDMGSVVKEIKRTIAEVEPKLGKGGKITLRGQVQTMESSYIGLLLGLAGAIVLVYLLIVVNFQSWLDPLIIISALPAALAGIAWMLLLSGTHLSVPALTGAIMTMGVATANSILMVSFARQRLDAGVPPLSAALEAGATRIRPVLMTASAMIIGMLPMALSLGEGAEQNAPLGRAVIGGLIFATVSTLFFVPVVFASVHRYIARRESRVAATTAGI